MIKQNKQSLKNTLVHFLSSYKKKLNLTTVNETIISILLSKK